MIYFLRLSFILLFVYSINLQAQLSGTLTVPGTYTSIAAAITDLNSQGVNGPVVIQIAANYTETAPVGGYSLYATGTNTNTITFSKSGTGANPLITAYTTGTAVSSTAAQDGIWRLIGCDYVTIDGIDLFDPNTTNPATMEFGYGLFKSNITNGCLYNTIKNCVITLSRDNVASGAGPAQEGSRGIDVVNATTAAHTIALVPTTAFGSNSYNQFYSNVIQNCNIGIALIGYAPASPFTFADQYNDVGGLSAVTGNTIINFGGGSALTNPPSTGIKTLAQYYLNISYNYLNNNNGSGVNHVFLMKGIFTQAAQSANLSIANNTISLQGGSSFFTVTAIENLAGNTAASNSVNISGNLITGCTYTPGMSAIFYGIRNNGAASASLIISNNTFSNNLSNATGNNFSLIDNTGAAPYINISGNSAVSTSLTGTAGTGIFFFINNASSTTGGTVTINSNTLQSLYTATNSAKDVNVIRNSGNGGATGRNEISGNVINNVTFTSTGTAFFINNSNNVGNNLVVGNSIVGSFSKLGGSGNLYAYFFSGSTSAGTATIAGNNFSNMFTSANTNIAGIYQSTSSNHTVSVYSNTITNTQTGNGTTFGIELGLSNNSSIFNNSISNFNGAGTLYGIATWGATNTLTIHSNTISAFTSTAGGYVVGYYQDATGVSNFYKNKIYDLNGNGLYNSVYGIQIVSGSTSNIYNNLIGDLKAPIANDWNVVNGMVIEGGSNHNIYYNTVRINATSSGFDFGSSAIYSVVTPTLNLRNNIFINVSTPNGSAYTVAYRRSTIGLTTYASTSNNNLFYAGTPSSNRLIFSDATNLIQTLSSYKTFVSPRDASSITENTSFLSTVGTSTNFLHVDPFSQSLAESKAVNLTGISSDFDNDIRQGNLGYVGNGLAPDVGADEFGSIYPNCSGASAATISPLSYTLCVGQTASFAATIAAPPAPGIEYQWKIATSAGGPYTTITNATALSYTAPTLTQGTFYYVLATTCTITNQAVISNEATVTVHPYPVLSVSPTNATICSPGGLPVLLTASGATNYSWTPNSGLSSTNTSTTTALPSNTSTYVVTGTNLGGCTSTANAVVFITQAAGNLAVSVTPNTLCAGSSAVLSAVGTSTVYSITPISYAPIPTPTSGVGTLCNGGSAITPISSGNLDDGNWYILSLPFNFTFYGITYVGISVSTNGFITFGNVVPNTHSGYGLPLPNFSAGRPAVGAVYGDLTFATTGTIHAFTSGVTPNRKYVINWINGRYASSNSGTVTTQVILHESSNFVDVHTTMNTGQQPAVQGIQNDNGTIANVVTGRNSQTFTVSSTPDAYRWSTPLTYSWSPGTYLSSTSIANPVASNILSTISYTGFAIAANGCVRAAVATVTVIPTPTLSISGGTTICVGATVNLSVTGANTYTWYSGAQTTSISVSPSVTTSYSVKGLGTLNSCTASAVQVITVNPLPPLTISGSHNICIGRSTTLSVSGADTYTWNNSVQSNSIIFTPTGTTNYTIAGTNTLTGCGSSSVNTIMVSPLPTLAISGNTSTCYGYSTSIFVTGANVYSWNSGFGGSYLVVTPLVTTNYTITGTTVAAGCTATIVHTIVVLPTPTVSAFGSTSLCAGQSTTLSAGGAEKYVWTHGPTTPVISVTPAITTTFTVFGLDTLTNCGSNATVEVTVNPNPTLVVTAPPAICTGQTATLSVNGGFYYLWNNGSTLTAITETPTTTGSYSVTGTDIFGCSSSAQVTVTVHQLPTVTVSASPKATVCLGESILLTSLVNGVDGYLWSNGATSNSLLLQPTTNANYTLTVKNNQTGCSSSANYDIFIDPCSAIKENNASSVVSLYPNPFVNSFYIDLKGENEVSYQITDQSGRIIQAAKLSGGRSEINMSEFSKGMYYLVLSGNGQCTYKLISL